MRQAYCGNGTRRGTIARCGKRFGTRRRNPETVQGKIRPFVRYDGCFERGGKKILDNVNLKFTNAALEHIAHIAYENKTGARGLKSIIEKKMIDLMFEAPSENISEVTVSVSNGEIILKKKKECIA